MVLDLDTHGTLPDDWRLPGIRDGRDVLAQLCEWAGQPWPSTRTHGTPLDGWHLIFAELPGREIRNSAGKIGPLIDVRARGGYILGAGSVLDERAYPGNPAAAEIVRGGKAYEVIDDRDPVQLPAWLATLAAPPRPEPRQHDRGSHGPGAADARLRRLGGTVRAGKPGDRTGPLVWAAHRLAEMIGAGEASEADAELLVQAAVEAGIHGGEGYARYQVTHVLGGGR